MASAAFWAARAASRSLVGQCRTVRPLSTSSVNHLPRQGLPRPPPLSSASTSATKLDDVPYKSADDDRVNTKIASSRSEEDVPWFLQDEETIEVAPERPIRSQTSKSPTTSAHLKLPEPLASLHDLLTEGSPSALIARAEDIEGGKDPIAYINAKKYSEDAWADWIVVVQVKSNAGGSVSRVAKDIGAFLKHERPPALDENDYDVDDTLEGSLTSSEQPIDSIEDFLGQLEMKPVKRKNRNLAEHDRRNLTNLNAQNHLDNGVRNWRPYKIISREAQDGMKLLHSSDPEKWNRKELATTFKISVESVRRILSSKWKPSAQVIARQNRRAIAREQEKRAGRSAIMIENAEVDAIREAMLEGNEDVDEDEQEYRLQGEDGNEQSDRYVQQVVYEGLVQSGEDRRHTRGKSSVSRGDGEWCLVDAGWCVVHVMTARARQTYDVEAVASDTRATDMATM